VLDPYSATVFSSSPQVFAAVERYVERGFPMAQAIERIAYPDDPGKWSPLENVDVQEAAE
jgi:conjugal transfer ATP-binding protein TraC